MFFDVDIHPKVLTVNTVFLKPGAKEPSSFGSLVF